MANEHRGAEDAGKGDAGKADAAAGALDLRWLRRLVTALAVAMMLGIAAIVAILWLRLSAPVLPDLPANIALPQGIAPAAVTFARDWTVVVAETGEILLYAADGTLRRRVDAP